jgi:hypothetical protein
MKMYKMHNVLHDDAHARRNDLHHKRDGLAGCGGVCAVAGVEVARNWPCPATQRGIRRPHWRIISPTVTSNNFGWS